MGTRAAAFTAKIRNLQEFYVRLTSGIQPIPTGFDIANTLKHFSSVLLGVLKDVPQFPLEMLRYRSEDAARMQLFPSLDYKGLYSVVIQLLDVVNYIQFGSHGFGQAFLHIIACLLPFLEHEQIDTLPYTVAASLNTFPASLHREIINLLCHYLLPFTLYDCKNVIDKSGYATQSVSAVLMMVFQHTTNSEFHCQVLETVMSHKRDAVKDMLCVIAYGTIEARNVATTLLVYYWPHSNSHIYDRRNIRFKFNGYPIPTCKSEMCSVNNTGGSADAVKICLDHSVAVSHSPENPPPLFLCQECSSRLESEQPAVAEHLYEVLLPVQKMPLLVACENKNCRSQGLEKQRNMVYCFDSECTKLNDNRPVRFCGSCHAVRHSYKRGVNHVFHESIQCPLELDDTETLNYHVESIVSVLIDAEPLATRGGNRDGADAVNRLKLFTEGEIRDPISTDDRRLMGRFGIWLLVGFFKPEEDVPKEILGRLLSVLFQWFNTTAYLGNDATASTIERLKAEMVIPWLKTVIQKHFDTFVSCLLPHPPEFARVGGHWDVISSRTFHLREGFSRLFCLVPYEVISPEIWSNIMPNWMEAMASEVPEEEMAELKIILSKVMDPEMNPLDFDARQMYQFIAVRFHQTSHKVKEQALKWLQVLSKLEIVIPLYFIFSVFREGIRPKEKHQKRGSISVEGANRDDIAAICQEDSPNASSLSDDEDNLTYRMDKQSDSSLMLSSFILMLDVILKQLELQEVEQHKGLMTLVAKDAMVLLHNMVAMPWPGTHTCQDGQECQFCEMAVLWYELALDIVEKLAPENSALPPDTLLSPDGEFGAKSFPEAEKKAEAIRSEVKPSPSPKSESMGLEGIIVNMPQQILTATVETVSEMDVAPIIPSEKVLKAVARAVTTTETETASATAQIASATLVGDRDDDSEDETGANFWPTSVGKFKFAIEELPAHLQFTYELLKKIPNEDDSEVMHHLLKCLKILFLHGEVMIKASRDHPGFLIWCQENLLIRNLWELMDAEYSQICQEAVPLLLHCITIPIGADVFWRLIEEDFQSPDWRKRFTAMERVITITRFMDTHPIKNSPPLQTSLANIYCYAIRSLDDPNVAVAQRATLFLGTVNDTAIHTLMACLEFQFDTVIVDRPIILQSLYLLMNSVSDRKILRWNFFLNCFDTLYIEAQINLEKAGEVTYSKEIKCPTNSNVEQFIKKLRRAHEAINRTDMPHGTKTLLSTLGSMFANKQNGTQGKSNGKSYGRTQSAPLLKRKGSRHGVDGKVHGLISGEDDHLIPIFHKIIEAEETDKETIHLLVFLFMQFLSRYNRGPIPSDNRALGKTQNTVLKHLTMLLGYNAQDKTFFQHPWQVRCSTIFNSFMSTLPQVMDQNFQVGSTLLPIALTILHYCPAPNKAAGYKMHPVYSLWYLEAHVRRNWLLALIVILYKYEYGVLPLSSQVQTVIRIVLNTLNYQEHRCRPLPSTLLVDEPVGRSREISRLTLMNMGDLEHITEHETPPISPSGGQTSSPGPYTKNVKKGPLSMAAIKKDKKNIPGVTDSFEMMSSTETNEEIEPELAAIPESPKSSFRDLMFAETEQVVAVQPQIITCEEVQPTIELPHASQIVRVDSPKIVDSAPNSASFTEKSKSSWPFGSKGATSPGDADSKSSGSSGGSNGSKGTPTDFPWHLSVQAAFQVAKIPAPPLERLLPVGFNPPPLSPTVKSFRPGTHESPEHQSTRMGMVSIGPTVTVDGAKAVKHEEDLVSFDIDSDKDALTVMPSEKSSEYAKAAKVIQKGESYSRTSPKKLMKQSNVYDPEATIYESRGGAKKEEKRGYSSAHYSNATMGGWIGPDGETNLAMLQCSFLRVGEDSVQERCSDCGARLEMYGNEDLGLCIVALETFIHREPSLAASFLPDILKAVSRIALKPLYPWQAETSTYLAGGVSSVAHQFIRCVLHQLAPFGIFVQLFQTKFPHKTKIGLFKSISYALTDFTELNPVAPLQLLFEALNDRKTLVMENIIPIIENVATYLECLPLEAASATWSAVIPLCETFLRRITPLVQTPVDGLDGILRTMACLLRLPGISSCKSILDPFSKLLSFVIQYGSLKYNVLNELCHLCHRGFPREREKLFLTRVAVYELVQAIKFKANVPDANFLVLVTFVLHDAGGSLAPFVNSDDFPKFHGGDPVCTHNTGAAECMRQNLTDTLDFLADFHSLSKIKSNYKGNGCGLNEDTLGGVIKGGISQFIALEISRGNSRENRAIGRHLPWLYNPPSAIQQGPKEFLDCVAHIRVLSWLLLGALTHTAMFGTNSSVACNPIPLEASCHVADHVVVILTGFFEQSKCSVLHMSSLFHAFILCQVWTVYLEHIGPTQTTPSSDPANVSTNILTDFWGKVTPAVLQLISHSKVLAEMVNLHFLTLLESLLECNSSVFNRLLPLWTPVVYAHSGQLPGHIQMRLQACLAYPPPHIGDTPEEKQKSDEQSKKPGETSQSDVTPPSNGPVHNSVLLNWVQRLQFKMGQIELQSSAATQFYPL